METPDGGGDDKEFRVPGSEGPTETDEVARAYSEPLLFGPLARSVAERHQAQEPEFASDQERFHANYEESSENVRERWNWYKMAENYRDIVAELIDGRQLTGDEKILDVGTADGELLWELARKFGFWNGQLLGLELHPAQYRRSKYWKAKEEVTDSSDGWETFGLNPGRAYGATDEVAAHFMAGTATAIPLENDTVDIVSAMFMLYHLKATSQRNKAYEEFKRVLRPGGEAWIATSGITNKVTQRIYESQVAAALGVKPPEIMNAQFTTEIAQKELPTHFRYGYGMEYKDVVRVDSVATFVRYIKSLVSMRDQFQPVPKEDDFVRALNQFTGPLWEGTKNGAYVEDVVSRSIFICRETPLEIIPEHYQRLW